MFMSWTTTDFFIKFCLEMNANVFLREKEKYKKIIFTSAEFSDIFAMQIGEYGWCWRDSVLKMQTRNLQFVINGDFFFFLNASQPIYGKIIWRRVSFIQREF